MEKQGHGVGTGAWVSLLLFIGLTIDVMLDGPIFGFAQFATESLIRVSTITQLMEFATFFGGVVWIVMASLFLFLIFFVTRSRLVWLVLLVMGGGELLKEGLKLVFRIARPENGLIEAMGFAYPSGHAMMSMLLYGLLIYFLWKKRMGWLIALLLSIVIFIIGFKLERGRNL